MGTAVGCLTDSYICGKSKKINLRTAQLNICLFHKIQQQKMLCLFSAIGMAIMLSAVPVYLVFIAWKSKPRCFEAVSGLCVFFAQIMIKFSTHYFFLTRKSSFVKLFIHYVLINFHIINAEFYLLFRALALFSWILTTVIAGIFQMINVQLSRSHNENLWEKFKMYG